MHAIKHVLCPVDFSAPSAQALRCAAAFSAVVGAELTILYVRAVGHQRDLTETSDTSLAAFAATVVGREPSHRLLERRGEPVTEILHAAVNAASDLIVMGTHGRTGLQRLLLGSVAERVIRRSPTPVMTIPPAMALRAGDALRLARVLCAVSLSEPSSRAVGYASSIAAAAGAHLVLAHALEWSEESDPHAGNGSPVLPSSEADAMARLGELVTDDVRARCHPELVVGYGPPADEILRVVRERDVDLVVLGVQRRNPIDLAVFGSTAQRLLRDGACAVLTVRTRDDVMPEGSSLGE